MAKFAWIAIFFVCWAPFKLLSAEITYRPAVIEKNRYIPGAIVIKGEIQPQDYLRFASLYRISLGDKLPVEEVWLFGSNGGDLETALLMGDVIDNLALKVRVITNCYSACAFIALAAKYRIFLGDIGLHRPYINPSVNANLSASHAEARYAVISHRVRGYLQKHGISTEVIDRTFSTSSSEAWMISAIDAYQVFGAMKPSFHEWVKARCPSAEIANATLIDVDLDCLHRSLHEAQIEAFTSVLKSGSIQK